MKKTILGIDPGTRISGYALLNPLSQRDFTVVDLGIIKAPNQESLSERLLASTEALEQLIDHFSPVEMAIESQFVYKNARSALLLSSFTGAFIVVAKKKRDQSFLLPSFYCKTSSYRQWTSTKRTGSKNGSTPLQS